jgi:hypothetical protein
MAADAVTGGDAICDVIEDILDDADALVEEVSWDAAQQHLAQLRESAAAHPRWQGVASEISMWANEKGNIAFGVRSDSPRADEASAAEYGDATHAPAPLIRMGMLNGVTDMGWSMREAFQQAGF